MNPITSDNTFQHPSITFLLGGVRAGKSARAISMAESLASPTLNPLTFNSTDSQKGTQLLFVATAQAYDEEMKHRILTHQNERSDKWQTIEEPLHIVTAIQSAIQSVNDSRFKAVIVIDCLTLWVSNLLLQMSELSNAESRAAKEAHALVALMQSTSNVHWILVSNETGLGVVPPTQLGRVYRDALGRVNQIVAAAANTVELMVAGIVVPIKPNQHTHASVYTNVCTNLK